MKFPLNSMMLLPFLGSRPYCGACQASGAGVRSSGQWAGGRMPLTALMLSAMPPAAVRYCIMWAIRFYHRFILRVCTLMFFRLKFNYICCCGISSFPCSIYFLDMTDGFVANGFWMFFWFAFDWRISEMVESLDLCVCYILWCNDFIIDLYLLL